MSEPLPELPYADWRQTKDTLHLWCQVLGKIKLSRTPPRNHWWSVALGLSVRGITTGRVPGPGRSFEVELDLLNERLVIRTDRGEEVVRTVAAGRITALTAALGRIVSTGTDVAVVEKVARASDPLYATVYVPAENAAAIPDRAAVDLTVSSVPAQRYGVLRGHVKSVDRTAQSAQRIAAYLGDAQLGEQFTRKGRPVAVLVRLDASPTTKSGYRWSSADGPPYRIDSMTPASASIRLTGRRPVDWLLP